MQWTEEREVMMMREVIGKNVLIHKSGTQERSNGWQKVADTLNTIEGFHLTDRAVRDKINALILSRTAPLMNKNIQDTGVGGEEPTEHEVLIEEVINVSDDTAHKAQEAATEATEKERNEREAALEVRRVAMEHRAETAERKKKGESMDKPKPQKRTSSDTVEFLREKLEFDRENRQKERDLQENQLNIQNQLLANLLQTNQQMMAQQTFLMQELLKQKQKD